MVTFPPVQCRMRCPRRPDRRTMTKWHNLNGGSDLRFLWQTGYPQGGSRCSQRLAHRLSTPHRHIVCDVTRDAMERVSRLCSTWTACYWQTAINHGVQQQATVTTRCLNRDRARDCQDPPSISDFSVQDEADDAAQRMLQPGKRRFTRGTHAHMTCRANLSQNTLGMQDESRGYVILQCATLRTHDHESRRSDSNLPFQ